MHRITGTFLAAGALAAATAAASAQEVRIARQFSMGYLQFNVMEHDRLLEKHTAALGLKDVKIAWSIFNGPDAMNNALISDSVDIVAGGTPGLVTLWARTKGTTNEAIARMTRALEEYEVLGIKTTIPFFLWLMREPDYIAGRFDTTYLDRLLEARRGESFSAFTGAEEQRIAIAAALDAWFRASGAYSGGAPRSSGSAWTIAARQEALRWGR